MALKHVEEMIAEARKRGEFDDLAGRGKPIDHSAYFRQPPELRMGHALLRNAGVVPPEVELLRERGELQVRYDESENAAERAELLTRIERLTIKLDLMRRQR